MKPKILLCVFLLFNHLTIKADPLLVAVLMVKNEEPVMQTTLQPLVNAGITDYLIYDTGSTDNTVQITKDFFVQNNITNFVIEQGVWVDFATSRNKALELTEQHFPDTTFMLMLDAEWILHNGSDLLKYCKKEKNKLTKLYFIKVSSAELDFHHARLIRCRSNIAFIGKVHEVPSIPAQDKIPGHIYFELSPTHYGQEKTRTRWLRDLEFLLQDLQENPDNPRTVHFLAQTYFCLQNWQNAIKWYEQRTTMSGWDEETFIAYLMLAAAYQLAGNQEKMINNYLKAFALRPHRAEPLIRLAQHYYDTQNYHLCYVFAKYAVAMPYPYNDFTPIEKWLYDFVRYNLISITASISGEFKLGKQATMKALEVCPHLEYLQNNLKYYQTMLGEK